MIEYKLKEMKKMNHLEEVKEFTTIKAISGFVILVLGLLQPVLFYIFTPDPYNVSIVEFATVIIIDIILIGSVLSITYKKYHEYHITDMDFFQVQ